MNSTKIDGVVAVILAAGLSLRMAPENKLLLDFGGEPLVRRIAREAVAEPVRAQTFVVVGHDRWNVRKAIADLPVTIVENPDYTESQMTSVRAGVLAAPEAKGYLIIPGDMPLLTAADFDRLIARFEELGADKAVVPFDETERGNPIVIPGWSREEMYRRGINFGCRNLLINYPGAGVAIEDRRAAILPGLRYARGLSRPAGLVRTAMRPAAKSA